MDRRLQNSVAGGHLRRARSLGFALLVFALALSAPAFPADAQPELELQPAIVSLPPVAAQPATALIVLHNRSDAVLRNLRLSWFSKPGLEVRTTTPLTLAALAPHADYVWVLAITPSHAAATPGAAGPSAMARPGGPEAGAFTAMAPPFVPQRAQIDENLDLRLDYETVAGGRASPQVLLKSLPVKTEDPGALDKVLDVQIKTTLNSLANSEWASIYLVLKNTSTRVINIMNMAPIGSGVSYCQESQVPLPYGSLPFCFYSSLHSLTLGPHQTAIEEFPVKGHTRVRPGTYLLVFHIVTQSSEGGAPILRSLIVTQPVDVDVPGQPAILIVAGIPVFFLLPGMLLLLTVGLCWSLENRWWSAPDRDRFPFQCSGPNFWLVSITISLLIAIVPWLFRKRWYFTRYGLQDVAWLWLASILAGIVCYTVWWLYRNHRKLLAEERIRLLADAEAAQLRVRAHDLRSATTSAPHLT
jgi:hypothetical protein